MMLRVVLGRMKGKWWTRTKLLDTADMREPDIRISIAVRGKYIVMDREMMRTEYAGSAYSQYEEDRQVRPWSLSSHCRGF